MKKRLLAMFLSVVLLIAFMPVVALAGKDEGWDESHTHYWYYDTMVTDEMYYVNADHSYYYFQSDGTPKKGWIKYYGNYYYGNPDKGGQLVLGWKKIGGYWYYFAKEYGDSENGWHYDEGQMYDKPDKINGKWYYFGKSNDAAKWGKLQYNWIKDKDEYGNVTWFYGDPDKDGQLAAGWKKIGGKWYYFEKGTDAYYDYGTMYFGGVSEINGYFYYFSNNGDMKTGWIKETDSYTDTKGNKWNYEYWYYADPNNDSRLTKGWKKIGGKWYYFEPDWDCQMAANKTLFVNGKLYAFNHDGSLHEKAGWVEFYEDWTEPGGQKHRTSEWAYTDSNGIAVKGWKKIGGYWYCFTSSGYMISNDWASDSVGTCRMDKNGHIIKDKWIKVDGNWYYLKPNGYRAENEWARDSKGWLYMDESGCITYDEVISYKGKQYYVGDDGYMVVNKEFTVWYDGAFHDYRADKNGVLELIRIHLH